VRVRAASARDADADLPGRLAGAGTGRCRVSGRHLRVHVRTGSVEGRRSMIVKADGSIAGRQVQKLYDPRLAKLLMALDAVLHEQGLGLFCTKCHRLGMPDGVRGLSTETEYVLECGCARRSFAIATGKCTVQLQ
jgi:hypothetical protein